MKPTLLALLTAALLASCAPQKEGETTTTTETTTTETTTDTAADTTDTTTETTTETTDTETADTTTEGTETADTSTDSTLANSDDANTSEELDMAVGDGLEGTVTDFDSSAQTFTLNENDANYAVTITPETVFEGTATTAEDFFGSDRADANVAVEGEIDETNNTLNATKITLN